MSSTNISGKPNEAGASLRSLLLSAGIFALMIAAIWAISSVLGLHSIYNEPWHDVVFLEVQIALSIISSLLLIVLLSQYLDNHFRFGTEFTLAFVILALTLLAHSITSNPMFFSNFDYDPMEGPFSVIPLLFTTAATLALLYLNSK